MAAEQDFDLAAAELRAGGQDLDFSVETLAGKLEQSLPGLVTIRRRKVGRFRSKRLVVEQILVTLGEQRFELQCGGEGLRCMRHNVVGGITLKREELTMTDWISQVVAGVKATAEITEQSRLTLEGLLR